MTEKHYGGASGFGFKGKPVSQSKDSISQSTSSKSLSKATAKTNSNSEVEGYDNYIKAGEITRKTVEYAKSIVKKGIPLLELADKIESKIIELGGKPAFPVNLSINEIAAHYSPSYDDKNLASGLLKVDLGAHVEGFAADTEFSVDLEGSEENKKMIQAAESALKDGIQEAKKRLSVGQIGAAIEKNIQSTGFEPIRNLSGHSIEEGQLHAGVTVPNYDTKQEFILEPGVYAIEPFVTTKNGAGIVRDSRPSGIYELQKEGTVRDTFAREVLTYIMNEYSTLPFCVRWIYKKFGSRGLLALRQIESAGLLHHYSQLVEKNNCKVAQAESTIIVTKDDVIVITG
jgi:methionyl aminopeptidase